MISNGCAYHLHSMNKEMGTFLKHDAPIIKKHVNGHKLTTWGCKLNQVTKVTEPIMPTVPLKIYPDDMDTLQQNAGPIVEIGDIVYCNNPDHQADNPFVVKGIWTDTKGITILYPCENGHLIYKNLLPFKPHSGISTFGCLVKDVTVISKKAPTTNPFSLSQTGWGKEQK